MIGLLFSPCFSSAMRKAVSDSQSMSVIVTAPGVDDLLLIIGSGNEGRAV